jgi:hypothetical protein
MIPGESGVAAMTFRGIVRNGRVELEPGTDLPEGSSVEVELRSPTPNAAKRKKERPVDPAFRISDLAVDFGRKDSSVEHDHYLYGTPKRSTRSKKSPRSKVKGKATARR